MKLVLTILNKEASSYWYACICMANVWIINVFQDTISVAQGCDATQLLVRAKIYTTLYRWRREAETYWKTTAKDLQNVHSKIWNSNSSNVFDRQRFRPITAQCVFAAHLRRSVKYQQLSRATAENGSGPSVCYEIACVGAAPQPVATHVCIDGKWEGPARTHNKRTSGRTWDTTS